METQNIKFSQWKGTENVDACVWRESGKYNVYFLNIVRIFLEIGDGHTNRIGEQLYNLCCDKPVPY